MPKAVLALYSAFKRDCDCALGEEVEEEEEGRKREMARKDIPIHLTVKKQRVCRRGYNPGPTDAEYEVLA